jgi:hypothetical protein
LVDVFEEDPVVEAAALGALAASFRHNSTRGARAAKISEKN